MSPESMQALHTRIIGAGAHEGFLLGLPNEEYHRESCGISNSMLKQMDPTPRHLIGYLEERERRAKEDAAEAERTGEPVVSDSEKIEHFLVGSLVHHALLTPDEPMPRLVCPPAEYPSEDGYPKNWNWNAKYCKRWRADQRRAGRIVLSHDAYRQAQGCVQSVCSHPKAVRYLRQGIGEVSGFARWTLGWSLMRRFRLDWLPPGKALVDVKTVPKGGADPEEFAKIMVNFGYDQQAAYYLDAFNDLVGLVTNGNALVRTREISGEAPTALLTQRKETFVFIVVEKEPPYACAVYYVANEVLERGRRIYTDRLQAAAEACHTGNWPSYTIDMQCIGLPGHIRRKEAFAA